MQVNNVDGREEGDEGIKDDAKGGVNVRLVRTGVEKKGKRTTPGIPTWSPTVVLTRPEHA